MNDQLQRLSQRLKDMAGANGPSAFADGVVLEVYPDTFMCDILLDGEVVAYDVRLRALQSDNSSIDVLPAVGSTVIVGKLDSDDYLVLACDQISSYRVFADGTTIQMDKDGVQISKGSETMNKLLNTIVDMMLAIYAPKDVPGLNALKVRINDMLK